MKSDDDDILKEAHEAFNLAMDAESENREAWLDDVRFSRIGEQWPEEVRTERNLARRPMLTINRLPAFIRQVVNDARQNKPQMNVKPIDSKGDIATAEVLGGLIKSIEISSKADIAYDTAVEYAVSGGMGYWRIDVDYEYNDSFEKALRIKRIANPLSVYGDPYSTAADSSDWNSAFVTSLLSLEEFERKYKDAEPSDWEGGLYSDVSAPWRQGDEVQIAEWWARTEVEKTLLLMTDGTVMDESAYENIREFMEMSGNNVVNSRKTKGYKITHRLLTGAEVLETTEWVGEYIPIVPVYGEEINIEGRRYFRSMIRDAKDAQRMFNYWRTTATELVALAPRVPYIGPAGAFDGDDAAKWQTANTGNHPYLQYEGQIPPQRQPLDSGPAAGALQEAMNAADDLKSIMGLYDASLGARSNETSGKAILARQREGDVSSFHFIDNLNRAIAHSGCILVDLIPKVYTGERIVRIVGKENQEASVMLREGMTEEIDEMGQPVEPQIPEGVTGIYDISVGRYDVKVDSGPSFSTRREETAEQMMQLVQASPDMMSVIGGDLVRNLDWPGAERIADKLDAMSPVPDQQELPPEAQQAMDTLTQQADEAGQAAQQAGQEVQQLSAENQQLKAEKAMIASQHQLDKQAAALDKRAVELKLQECQMELRLKEMYHTATAQQPAPPAPMSVNMPDNLGASISENMLPAMAQALGPVVAQAVMHAISNTTVKSQRMKRTPVRDKRGLILHTVDEPIPDDPASLN